MLNLIRKKGKESDHTMHDMQYTKAMAYSEPCQISKMERFEKIVKAKSHNVCKDSEYASARALIVMGFRKSIQNSIHSQSFLY